MTITWQDINVTKAFETLYFHARSPLDLQGHGPGSAINKERLLKYICRSSSFDLHYATERVTEQVLDALQSLADEMQLTEKFSLMRRGAVLNKIEGVDCENRQVLHTACRDLFDDNPAEPSASEAARKELDKLKTFLDELETGEVANEKGEKFSSLIHIGIGGSDLGPRAVYEALKSYKKENRSIRFIANVDPDDAAQVLASVDLSRSLVAIVSKSGTTLETLANEMLVRQSLERAGLDPQRHCIAVTGIGSPMDDPGRYLRSFYMFDYVGGRYSVTSMVGLVTLGFALGFAQIQNFLRGASAVDRNAEQSDIRNNVPLLLALLGVWNHNFLGYPTVAILPYSQSLHRFPAHLQQCDMESNGKSINRKGEKITYKSGPVVWGEPGTNGQHAFYQLLHQGTEIVPAEFIGFRRSQENLDVITDGTTSQEKLLANLSAQMIALALGKTSQNPNREFKGNRPSCLLLAEQLNPETMGSLLAIYEAKIVFQGFVWNINSFDQEGVQLGKVLAQEFLKVLKTGDTSRSEMAKWFMSEVVKRG